jgi:hypothetical protein
MHISGGGQTVRILKKAGLDLLFATLLFVVAVFLAGAVSMENKDCVTCGARIATDFWFASVLALQPVLWVTSLKFGTHALIWLCSLIAGAIVYVLFGAAAMYLLSSGRASVALQLGYVTNIAGVLTAFAVSLAWVKNRHRRTKPQPASAATIEP